jgi:hypothetical protein
VGPPVRIEHFILAMKSPFSVCLWEAGLTLDFSESSVGWLDFGLSKCTGLPKVHGSLVFVSLILT